MLSKMCLSIDVTVFNVVCVDFSSELPNKLPLVSVVLLLAGSGRLYAG